VTSESPATKKHCISHRLTVVKKVKLLVTQWILKDNFCDILALC